MAIRQVKASTMIRHIKKGVEYNLIKDYSRTAIQVGERVCWLKPRCKELLRILEKAQKVGAIRLPNNWGITDNFTQKKAGTL